MYSYDQAGNKLTSTETIDGKELTTDFTYDDNNRLLTMKNDDQTIKYEYDKNGNRVKQSGTDEVLDYIYDTENRLLAVKDNKGLLMAALYDGDDNRVFTASRTEDTTAYQLFKRQEKKGKGKSSKTTSVTRDGKNNGWKSPKTSPNGEENSLFWYGFTENIIQAISSLPETVGNLWMNVFDTVSRAYHQKIAKDRANKEGIVVNPPSLGNRPGEGKVTYSSEVNEVLIPYTTREDTYNYYEVRNYVNDVNQENTQVLQTYDDEMKARETYTYGNERLSYTNEKTKDEYEYLTDARGSVTGMMQDGELSTPNSYSVFGTPEEVDETGNPFGYTGEVQDVTGYNYLRARYYDSQSGTFLTQDSYEGEEDNPLSQNGYTYVENNPINYADPTGHKKNFFQNVWSNVKKTAKKVVTKVKQVANRVVNTVKKVVSNVYNAAKKIVSNVWNSVKQVASYVYNGVKNTYNSVNSYLSGGGSGRSSGQAFYGSPNPNGPSGYYSTYPMAQGSPSGYGYTSYAQQQAVQTAYRQQRLNLEYQQVTGSKEKPKTKEGQNLLKNWNDALKELLAKFCGTDKKAEKQKKAKIKEVKLPTSRGEILRDYHWSTNSNMYVHNKTGVPSPEITKLYNRLLAEEHAPKKNSHLEFYTKMLQTGKHPITGKPITEAERTNAKIMTWGLALQPIAGSIAISKIPQANSTSPVKKPSGVTGTVWDDIKGTQPPIEGTSIPKSFEMTVNGKKFWVNPNGTKHMVEYSTRNLSHGRKITEQQLLTSLQASTAEVVKKGYQYNVPVRSGNWELVFSPPREAGQLPVIKHAQYMP